MQVLNQQAFLIFSKLIAMLGTEQYIKLESAPYMPLHFECVGDMRSGQGVSNIYSLMYSYLQNGDLMRDPEMCFLHFDNSGSNRIQGVVPYSYSLDALGLYEESVMFRSWHQMEVRQQLQQKHTLFANQWLVNIMEQGFII